MSVKSMSVRVLDGQISYQTKKLDALKEKKILTDSEKDLMIEIESYLKELATEKERRG